MTKVYLDTQYPKNLAEALRLLHEMQYPKQLDIIRSADFENTNTNAVIFLFDRTKKGVDLITEKHFYDGYRVFAFKSRLVPKVDIFQLSLSVVALWPQIIDKINSEEKPFIFTYKYSTGTLRKFK